MSRNATHQTVLTQASKSAIAINCGGTGGPPDQDLAMLKKYTDEGKPNQLNAKNLVLNQGSDESNDTAR